jgi:hypothetical protein
MGAAPASSQAPGAGEAAEAPKSPESRKDAAGAMPQAPPAPALGYGPKALPSGIPDATSHSVTPPSTLQAPVDSGRNDLRAAAPERSASDCLAERQKDRPDLRPAVARPATYSGKPAWLLVYAVPPPSPGGPEQVAVYLVGRADCNVLTYQVFGAP